MNEENIRLYGLLSCPHCQATKKLLDGMGVSYELIFVDLLLGEEKGDTMRELRRFNPECTFPTLVVGDRVIVGYKEEAIREALRDHSG